MDDLGVPRPGKFVLSWVYHPRALPLAVPAAALHMAAQRGNGGRGAASRGYALPERSCQGPCAAAASAGTVSRDHRPCRALSGAHVLYAKEWGSPARYGNTEAETALRQPLVDWRVQESWFAGAQPDCHFMHCLPVRRNVAVADEVLDGPRSEVIREAANRMVVRWPCSTDCSRVRRR